MRMKYIPLLVWELLGSTASYATGRFYVGLTLLGTLQHSKVSLDNDYWGAVIKEVYKDSFAEKGEKITDIIKNLIQNGLAVDKDNKTKVAPFYANSALPADLLQDRLHDQKAECYDGHPFAAGFSATLGLFCLRSRNILASLEITGGRTFQNEKSPGKFCVLSAHFPFPFSDEIFQNPAAYSTRDITYTRKEEGVLATISTAEDVYAQWNPRKNTQAPLTHLQSPSLGGISVLEFKETFSMRLLLRVGSVLHDRVYLYALLGGEATRLHFKLKQILDHDFKNMYYAYPSNFNTSTSANLTFQCDPLPPKEGITPDHTKLTCDQSTTRLAIVGGIGSEFFINRRWSARLDMTVAFGPDTLINTDRSVKLRYSELRGQAGLGVVWRF